MTKPSVVWFRNDLRLDDQPALMQAAQRGAPVIPAYIWSPDDYGKWKPGAASRWWLHHSLVQLDEGLARYGSKLIIRRGTALPELLKLIDETGADAVYWTRRYEPEAIKRDSKIQARLQQSKIITGTFNGQLLFEPWEIQAKQGQPYQVFTAFWRTCLARGEPGKPQSAPRKIVAPKRWPASLSVDELQLLPTIPWDSGLKQAWCPGSKSARRELNRFLKSQVGNYNVSRDVPADHGTSRMSAHLHFGEVSPRRIWHESNRLLRDRTVGSVSDAVETYLKELGWREFAHHLLFHFPQTTVQPLRSGFSSFPWKRDAKTLRAWQRGETGYPIVDAGMRELWTTGWMHNRVRMIVASFLVKDLLISWQEGADWFWDTLVDADLANNTLGWQWSAGCGADAAPYFRVFNPALQSKKFDKHGKYLRRWIAELKDVPSKFIHAPWTAPADVLAQAGVELGRTYPNPIVDHRFARVRALGAFKKIATKTK